MGTETKVEAAETSDDWDLLCLGCGRPVCDKKAADKLRGDGVAEVTCPACGATSRLPT